MSSHLNRQDIVKAAADPRSFWDHLRVCPACRMEVELHQLAATPEMLVDAPQFAIERARAVARAKKTSTVKSLLARLTFDSWTDLAPASVRGLGPEKERRLRFETETLRFDLRAEKAGSVWTLAAQVKSVAESEQAFEVETAGERIRRRPDDFYIWSASRPPRTLRLVSSETTIILPEITWDSQQKS